ncbi:MAG: hypothetical protein J6A96_03940, partial [Clostridia bacterium]|nr:hypothetical protein [Clostridia bacterium]
MKSSVFKRIFCLMLVAAFIFSLFACSTPSTNTGTQTNTNTNTESSTNTGTNTDTDTDEISATAFTVTLVHNGEKYIPTEEITVYWTKKNEIASTNQSVHSATFNKDGVAWVDGLDGDYRVTLSKAPGELAYNPNVHEATNNKRNIEIELYDVIKTT